MGVASNLHAEGLPTQIRDALSSEAVLASHPTPASLHWVEEAGAKGGYHALKPDRGWNFENWLLFDHGERIRRARVERLRYHPVLLADSGRMVFARVGKETISYFGSGVSLQKPVEAGGRAFHCGVRFPEDPSGGVNVEIGLASERNRSETVRLRIGFDGQTAALRDVVSLGDRDDLPEAALARRVDQLCLNQGHLNGLLAGTLEPFRYARMGVEDPNFGRLLSADQMYEVRVVDFVGQSILVVTEHRPPTREEALALLKRTIQNAD